MRLKDIYRQEVEQGLLNPDSVQAETVHFLDEMSQELHRRRAWTPPSRSVFARWFAPTDAPVEGVQGLYLWGGVGRGKTHLCDMFYDALPFDDKERLHFHRFMRRIHEDLRALGDIDDPLPRIADDWASRARLLLLDEIHVHDITDAMLLGGLLTALFQRGVTLVTTSNVPPDDLYREGLQRARFLPAIAQIKHHCRVLNLDNGIDYRLRLMQTEPTYIVSAFSDGTASEAAQRSMQAHFDRLCASTPETRVDIEINKRTLAVRGIAGDLVWFDFDTLCRTPRSTHDYIEIATLFHTVLISDVPVMREIGLGNDAARRFLNLIDEFYDRGVKLIVSAEAPPDALYEGDRLSFEFERAASRLVEMQTTAYIESPHRS